MPLSYYIYYRVSRPVQAEALVRSIQSSLQSRLGIPGRLLRKRGEPATWMEIYEGVEDASAFEQQLAATVQAANFVAILETGSSRHMECFEDRCA